MITKSKIIAALLAGVLAIGIWNACRPSYSGPDGDLPAKISYNFHVRPILVR